MGNTFNIKIDENDIRTIRGMLSDFGVAADKVFYRSLKKTLAGVRTDAAKEIGEVVNAKKEAIDATFKTSQSAIGTMSAAFISTGAPIPLIDFKNTRQTNKGVSVQVRKDHPRKVVVGAFIAKMKSSHEGVFWREWHGNIGGKGKMEMAINKQGYAWSTKTQRYIPMARLPKPYRLKIKELYAPRIPDYIANGPVIEKILAQASQRLQDNLDHETDYELSKHK